MTGGALSETVIILFKAISAMSSGECPQLSEVNTRAVPNSLDADTAGITGALYVSGPAGTDLWFVNPLLDSSSTVRILENVGCTTLECPPRPLKMYRPPPRIRITKPIPRSFLTSWFHQRIQLLIADGKNSVIPWCKKNPEWALTKT